MMVGKISDPTSTTLWMKHLNFILRAIKMPSRNSQNFQLCLDPQQYKHFVNQVLRFFCRNTRCKKCSFSLVWLLVGMNKPSGSQRSTLIWWPRGILATYYPIRMDEPHAIDRQAGRQTQLNNQHGEIRGPKRPPDISLNLHPLPSQIMLTHLEKRFRGF